MHRRDLGMHPDRLARQADGGIGGTFTVILPLAAAEQAAPLVRRTT
jgi:hypothetical protein